MKVKSFYIVAQKRVEGEDYEFIHASARHTYAAAVGVMNDYMLSGDMDTELAVFEFGGDSKTALATARGLNER